MRLKALTALLVVAIVAIAGVGGVLADPAVTSDSDIEEGSSVYLDPTVDETEDIEFTLDNENTESVTVTVTVNETGTQLTQLTDTDDALNETDAESDTWVATVEHSDLYDSTEMDVGNETEIEVEIVHDHDDADDGTTQTNTSTFTFDATPVSSDVEPVLFANGDIIDSEDLSIGGEVLDASGILGTGILEPDHDTFEVYKNVEHEGQDNVTIMFDGDAADAFDANVEDVDSSEPVLLTSVWVSGEPVPVYAGEEGEFTDGNETHAVYDDSELVVELGEDREDAIASDIEIVSSGFSFGELRTTYDILTAAKSLAEF